MNRNLGVHAPVAQTQALLSSLLSDCWLLWPVFLPPAGAGALRAADGSLSGRGDGGGPNRLWGGKRDGAGVQVGVGGVST